MNTLRTEKHWPSSLSQIHARSGAGSAQPAVSVRARPSVKAAALPKPKPLAPSLREVVGYKNSRIRDIADNFFVRSSRENIAKVYAAAATLGVEYRAVSRAGMSGSMAFSYAARSSTPKAAPAVVAPAAEASVMLRVRVGGSSVLKGLFGSSPLAGTGYVRRAPGGMHPAPVLSM